MTAAHELTLHRRYATPIEDVWAALTESERLSRWLGSYVGHGRPGGTVEMTVTGEVDAGGTVAPPVTVTIHECAAPRRLAVDIPADGTKHWHVAVDLDPDGAGTQLRFTQRTVEGVDVADVEAGWSWYLDRLGAALDATPMPAWSDYAPDVPSGPPST